jgi:hypothetical protein
LSKRRKGKPVTLAEARPGIEVVQVQVADPYDGKPLTVSKNARVHPLDHMASRGRLTDAQKVAGDRFLEIFDSSQIGGAQAIDYSRVKVDVSFVYRGLDEGAMQATDELSAICRALGKRAYTLLVRIIGHRLGVFDLARQSNGHVDRKLANHLSDSIKEALDDLSEHFGSATGKAKPQQPYVRVIQPFRGKITVEDDV